MIFELMSNGTMARLPDEMPVAGLPELPLPKVFLLLPYNRYIAGTSHMNTTERWTFGKLGTDEEKEIFFYDEEPLSLALGEKKKVLLSEELTGELRAQLLRQMPVPGEHMPTALILRGLVREDHLIFDEDFLNNEGAMLESIEKEPALRMPYWAIRLALFRNDYEAVSRIKTWLKAAFDVFDSGTPTPRIWFSLTDLPGRQAIDEMEGLSFSLDDLQRMNSQSSRPVVLYSKAGYLILSDYGGEGPETAFRIWMFLPIPLWNEMREKRKLSIREIVTASWGYLDGLAAEKERNRFSGQRSLSCRG